MKKTAAMPKLVLYRKNEWVNLTEKYRIFVNNQEIAALERGKKKILKLEADQLQIHAEMAGGYASKPKTIKAEKGDTIEMHCSGFRFQALILPYFIVVISILSFLHENAGWSWLSGLPFIAPAAVYAFYFYVLYPERSLRLVVHHRSSRRNN